MLWVFLLCSGGSSFAELTQKSLDELWLKHLRHQETLGRSIDSSLENYFILKLSEDIADENALFNLELLLRKREAALYLKSLVALKFLLAGQESEAYAAFVAEEAQREFWVEEKELEEEQKQYLKDELYALDVLLNAGRYGEAEERSLALIKDVGLSENLLTLLMKSCDIPERRGLVLGLHFLRSIHADAKIEAQTQLIDALSALGQFTFAEKYIESELLAHPESLDLLQSQVKLADAKGDMAKLAETTRAWIKREPANYNAWVKYGAALRKTQKYEFAIGALNKAARMKEAPIDALKELALLSAVENKAKKLNDDLDQLRRLMDIGDFYSFLKHPEFNGFDALVKRYELDGGGR